MRLAAIKLFQTYLLTFKMQISLRSGRSSRCH